MQQELDAWTTDEGIAALPEDKKAWADMAKKVLAPYRDRIVTIEEEFHPQGPIPDLEGFPLFWLRSFGHTPGHVSYVIAKEEGEKPLLICIGDIVHIAEVQMLRPQTTIVFDSAPVAAREIRERTFGVSAEENYLLAGPHLPFPGTGTLEKDGDGYRFIPVK